MKNMKCFVIAMESEAQTVLRNMEIEKEYFSCNKKVVLGTLFGERIGVVVCGVGKVNAACGAQYAIDFLNVDCIVNLGVAGGLNDGLAVGKIYCIECAVEYDFDLAQLNGTPVGTLNEFTQRYMPLNTVLGYEKRKLATGDRFNDSEQDYLLLTKDMGADIRDMEGAAIVHACIHAKVPAYSFKCISDLANSGSTTEQFLQNLQLCTKNLTEELKNIMAAING